MSDPLTRAELLLDPARLPHPPVRRGGFLDLGTAPPVAAVGQRLMRFTPYASIYEAFRPHAFRLASGPSAPGRREDLDRAVSALALRKGSVVLDVGCGPGNFTGHFGSVVGGGRAGSGLAIGFDASEEMLNRAVADHSGPHVAYLRGDALMLPFVDASIDAVACFAALYLMDDPRGVLAECVRVLKPGGKLAILTSRVPSLPPLRWAMRLSGLATGVRIFGDDEVTEWLAELGLREVVAERAGLAQFVTAQR